MTREIEDLQGLKPFEAKLFAELTLPETLLAQLERANERFGDRGLTIDSLERCVWRIVCDRRPVAHLSFANRGTQGKALCFCCRADHRLFAGCGRAFAANPTPGNVWSSLQPYGRGNPETLERKFLEWGTGSTDRNGNGIEITDCVRVTCSEDEYTFLDQIKTSERRNEALLIFADWLEERGDERAEPVRRLTEPSDR